MARGQAHGGNPGQSSSASQTLLNTPQPLYSEPEELRTNDVQKDVLVDRVYVNAIKLGGKYRGKYLLHWRVAFHVVGTNRYVVIDTETLDDVVSECHTKAVPVLISLLKKNYAYHSNSVSQLRYEASLVDGISLFDVVNLIEEVGLHCFRYNSRGTGCFHWVKLLLHAMSRKGWFASTSGQQVISILDGIQPETVFGDCIIAGGDGTRFGPVPWHRV